MQKMKLSKIGIFTLFLLSGCSKFQSPNVRVERTVAYHKEDNQKIDSEWEKQITEEASSKNQHVEFPPGLTDEEKVKLWHLAEGSEIYPTLWLLALKSQQTPFHKGTPFLSDLDKKFRAIKDYLPKGSGYPLKWVGMTAAWDGEVPEEQDIILKEGETLQNLPKVKKLRSGKTTIAMTGVNCAFCHTAEIHSANMNGDVEKQVVEGGPSLVDVRGFFQDMVGSTVKTMLNKKELAEFLAKLNVKNSEEQATQFVESFMKDLSIEKNLLTSLLSLMEKGFFIGDKVKDIKAQKVREVLFEKREVITSYLIRLVKMTHDLQEVPELLKQRMNYLSNFLAADPDLIQTNSGHGRTDAFGRISNVVARGKNPIALTAPVSFPFMYAIKYKAMYHYNGNTNSVVTRNVGQAFGLGAILTNSKSEGPEKYAATSNLRNLIRLERYLYKLEIPQLKKIFPDVNVDKKMAMKGCNIYANKCMGCHQANEERVGPAGKLINYKIPLQSVVKTDDIYIKNQATPVNGVPFRDAIFSFTEEVKKWYATKHNVSREDIANFANEAVRGTEVFRDTYLGDQRFADDKDMSYINIQKGHGFVANSLAGIWATAPFLHNGSVPNIEELLKPSDKRVKQFIVGNNLYDFKKLGFKSDLKDHPFYKEKTNFIKRNPCEDSDPHCFNVEEFGNSNTGHEPSMYGGELSASQKAELIEFLKVLHPEPEYSWKEAPIYKIVDNKCELR
jgi:hypothetical protein